MYDTFYTNLMVTKYQKPRVEEMETKSQETIKLNYQTETQRKKKQRRYQATRKQNIK